MKKLIYCLWEYLDEPYLNFIIKVYDEDSDTLLCKTTVMLTPIKSVENYT